MTACLTTEDELLAAGSQLKSAVIHKDVHEVRKLSLEGLDLGLHLRGETALYLAVRLDQADMVKVLLEEMEMQETLRRSINSYSVDIAGKRETALICAVRAGLTSCVQLLADYQVDLESRDGDGHTALWHAVREQREGMVEYLVRKGAVIFYKDNDFSCPLLLACKTSLLKQSGEKIARLLISHGANIEYQDLALRNILFWVVFNNNRDLTWLIIKYLPRIQQGSWLEHQFLPQQIKNDKVLASVIKSPVLQPRSLLIQSTWMVRRTLSDEADGRSIVARIQKLEVGEDVKKVLRWDP